jgi:hypothetical protein
MDATEGETFWACFFCSNLLNQNDTLQIGLKHVFLLLWKLTCACPISAPPMCIAHDLEWLVPQTFFLPLSSFSIKLFLGFWISLLAISHSC